MSITSVNSKNQTARVTGPVGATPQVLPLYLQLALPAGVLAVVVGPICWGAGLFYIP